MPAPAARVTEQPTPTDNKVSQDSLMPISVPANSPRWFTKKPQSPTIYFYYSPKGKPERFDDSIVSQAISQALAAWDRGCNVHLVFQGINDSPPKTQSAKDGYWIQWEHSYSGFYGGHGGPSHGVTIDSKTRTSLELQSTLVHEVGHVLGMPHTASGIMGPTGSPRISRILDLTDDEFRLCNSSIERLYRVPAR